MLYSAESPNVPNQSQGNKFIQSALDALSAHVAILDEHGYIIGVNSAWKRFADDNRLVSTNYGIGTNYLEVCEQATGRNSKEAPQVLNGLRQIMNGQEDEFLLEYPCHSKFTKRWFFLHITRFIWDGQLRVVVSHQNVTEIKSIQVELAESRRRIEAILNNVANGILSISARGRLESVNPALDAMFGYGGTKKTLLGENVNNLLAEPTASMNYRDLLYMLTHHPPAELIGKRADGSRFPIYFAVNEIQLGSRRLYTGIINDLTDRKRMEAEIIENERLAIALQKEQELRQFKTRFISLMSHELRTPLASIRLSGDLLKLYADRIEREERDSYLDNIATQVEYLTSLVKDMVSVTGADNRQMVFTPLKVDIVSLCRQLVDEFSLNHRATHTIEFATSLDRQPIELDVKLMRQVLNNLLSNAIKYSPHGTSVRLRLDRDDDNVRLTISDEGIGIPSVDLPMLFEPFHRASNVENLPGTGLGLTIVKQSVEMHNGSIIVNSQPDKGTTFIISLPYRYGLEESAD